jgi:predicted regulator of Ras-like GTPase activity (Roadblock/LC7/MglB family)
MTSDVPAGLGGDPGWLLADLVERVSRTRSAVLLSADGMVTAEHGLGSDDADRLAPLASSLSAIARTVAATFDGKDRVRQILIDMDSTMLFASAGHNSVLAVLADRTADAGVLGYEMTQLVKSVQPFLVSQPRMRGAVKRAVTRAELERRVPRLEPPGPC